MSMKVALKIWRYDPIAGERALKEYEVDAPEWATLLDVLDIVKDRVDGTLAYRKSCRMMICGSCGMRMDGAAVPSASSRCRVPVSPFMPSASGSTNLDETPSGVMRTVSFRFPKSPGCPASPVLEPCPARGLYLAKHAGLAHARRSPGRRLSVERRQPLPSAFGLLRP